MIRIATLFILTAAVASAQATPPEEPGPSVAEGSLEMWDIASLKSGDWVAYEVRTSGTPKQATWRLACVGVEGGIAWIETDLYSMAQRTPANEPAPAAERVLVLAAVDRETRRIRDAWWGRPGEVGKKVKLTDAKSGAAERPSITGTGTVTRETVKAGGQDLECEKIELESTAKGNGFELKSHSTTWVSDRVSFRTWRDERRDERWGDIAWKQRPESKGGVVRVVTESSGSRAEVELTGFGTDARAALKKE